MPELEKASLETRRDPSRDMSRTEILEWLRQEGQEEKEALFEAAHRVRLETVGSEVHLRGLIEFSNCCSRKCLYCGIRSDASDLARYRMSKTEIVRRSELAFLSGCGTVVLQSGEDPAMSAEWLAEVVGAIKVRFPLAVTLSVGERPLDDYRRWRDMGADRYLLKLETTDEDLYRKIHPAAGPGRPGRIEILLALREMGYEIGGGVMVGLPGQGLPSLARDLDVFRKLDLDMVGSGPYIPHPSTPLGARALSEIGDLSGYFNKVDLLARKVTALTRVLCPEANIPATTALATVNRRQGYELGLKAGANVIMPVFTPRVYRPFYDVYPGRPSRGYEWHVKRALDAIETAGGVPGKGRGDRKKTLYSAGPL